MSLSYTLDVAGRRTVQTTRRTLEAAVTESVTNHYVDDSDDPGWVTTVTADTTSTTAYADLTSGGLSLSITTTGEATTGELALANPRGDVSATITLPADGETVQGLDRWTRYTEYGTPVVTPPTGAGGAAANGYGWLGAKQRTTTETGILLMGARLYNPVTGLFTSLDPVYGGNDTPYTYPNDPINKQDLSGKAWWDTIKTGLGVASLFGCGACGVAALVMSAVDIGRGLYKRNRGQVASAALDFVPFGIGRAGRVVARFGSSLAKKRAKMAFRKMARADRRKAKSPSRMAAKWRK